MTTLAISLFGVAAAIALRWLVGGIRESMRVKKMQSTAIEKYEIERRMVKTLLQEAVTYRLDAAAILELHKIIERMLAGEKMSGPGTPLTDTVGRPSSTAKQQEYYAIVKRNLYALYAERTSV